MASYLGGGFKNLKLTITVAKRESTGSTVVNWKIRDVHNFPGVLYVRGHFHNYGSDDGDSDVVFAWSVTHGSRSLFAFYVRLF